MSTIFNAEQMYSTKNPAGLRSGKYQVSTVDTAIDNGALVVVGALLTGEREVRGLTAPAAITDTQLGLIDNPELIYSEETTKGLEDYTNVAGEVVRVRLPKVGDIFAISAEGIDPLTDAASIAVGNVLTIKAASTLLEEKAAVGGTETFVCNIIDKYTMGVFFDGREQVMFGCEVIATA